MLMIGPMGLNAGCANKKSHACRHACITYGFAPSMANLCMRALACQPCMELCSAPNTEPGTPSSAYRIGTVGGGME